MKNIRHHIPRVAFCIFALKLLILGATWPIALVFAVITAAFLWSEYVDYQKNSLDSLKDKLIEYDEKVKALEIKLGHVSDSLGAVQISRGYVQKLK